MKQHSFYVISCDVTLTINVADSTDLNNHQYVDYESATEEIHQVEDPLTSLETKE